VGPGKEKTSLTLLAPLSLSHPTLIRGIYVFLYLYADDWGLLWFAGWQWVIFFITFSTK
jgi:hypothetical protein